MEIKNTKEFAKVYKELANYFYNIAPKKEVEEFVLCVDEHTGWQHTELQRVTETDKSGVVSLPVPQIPVSRDDFLCKKNLFIEELNENILKESDDFNRAVLRSVFGKIEWILITPTREMLINANLLVEALLLDDFLEVSRFIYDLQSEYSWVYSPMEEYRNALTNNTKKQCSQSPIGRGRPKETLKDKMINDADGSKLQKLHVVMNGKKGKDAALIIIACIKKGWMQKPTFTQVKEEFGNIGTQQGFTKYLNENLFTKNEIEGVINSIG